MLSSFRPPWETRRKSQFQLFSSLNSENSETCAMIALCSLETPRAYETPRAASESPRRTIRLPSGDNLVAGSFDTVGSNGLVVGSFDTVGPFDTDAVGSYEPGSPTPVLDQVEDAIDWNLWEMTPTNTPLRQAVLGQAAAEAPIDAPDNIIWEMKQVPTAPKNTPMKVNREQVNLSSIMEQQTPPPDLVTSDSSDELLPKHTKICRHFLRGFCKRGDSCNFLHDVAVFKPDAQKVFLGGLPNGITCEKLIHEFAKQGYEVLNRPQIHDRGFAPKVLMESVHKAKSLVKKGWVLVCGKKVDVRRYRDKHGDGVDQRSVFIGGLPIGITGLDLSRSLFEKGFTVASPPEIQHGYAPKVTLTTVDQAHALTVLGFLECCGKNVDVRVWRKPNGPQPGHLRPQNCRNFNDRAGPRASCPSGYHTPNWLPPHVRNNRFITSW